MRDKPEPGGVFISCVSDEFERDGAPFPGLRGQLRGYLARTRSNVRVQEDFPQTAVDTVRKLADEIRPRAVVVHLVLGRGSRCSRRHTRKHEDGRGDDDRR